VLINSFYNLKYALPHNYVINKFTGYARVLNYLDSGKFHVGKNPPHGGIKDAESWLCLHKTFLESL